MLQSRILFSQTLNKKKKGHKIDKIDGLSK